jgi:hypothetical protein
VGRFTLRTSELSSTAIGRIVDEVWDEILTGATHNIVNSAGRLLRTVSTPGSIVIRSGTAQAGSTSTTIKLDSGASATNNVYLGTLITLTGGTGLAQTRTIVGYNGTTKVATVNRPWVTTPDATTTFSIYANTSSLFSDEGTAQAGAASSITLASTASSVDETYTNSFVTIISGTGSGQTQTITAYNGTTKVASTGAWSVQPDSTSIYAVIPSGDMSSGTVFPTSGEISEATWNTLRANHTLTGSFGEGVKAESLNTQAKADVNGEVVDTLNVDTYAEPTGAPTATATLVKKLGFLHEALRNKITVTGSTKTFYDDAGVGQWTKTLSDNGTTYTEGEGA